MGDERSPIFSNFRLDEKPGAPFSTRNAVTPPWYPFSGSVIANTITRSATGPLEMKVLVPVDAKARALGLRAGPQREGIGPGAGLRHRVHADQRPVAKAGEVAPPLVLVAVLPQRDDARQEVGAEGEHEAAVVAAVAERLQGDRAGQGVDAAAAILLRHREALDADLPASPPQLARERLVAIAFGGSGVQRLLGEAHDVVAQDPLLFAEGEIHQASSLSRW